jgi:DNA-binding NtrC family response regulator
LPSRLKVKEEAIFRNALSETGGDKYRASQILGISRRTLHRRLASLNMEGAATQPKRDRAEEM